MSDEANPAPPAAPAASPPEGGAPPAGASAPPVEGAAPEPAQPTSTELYERVLAQDRKLQEARAKLKVDRGAFDAEREAGTADVQRSRDLLKLLKEDPVGFLDAANVSFDDFKARLAKGQQLDPRVEELTTQLAEMKTAQDKRTTDAQTAAHSAEVGAALRKFGETVTDTKAEGGEIAFGLTGHYLKSDAENTHALLQDVVKQIHGKTGKVPSFPEAATEIERQLIEDTKARLSIPSVRKMVRELLAEEAGETSSDTTKRTQAPATASALGDGPSTISHEMAAQPGPRGNARKTRREKLERLYAAAREDGIGI